MRDFVYGDKVIYQINNNLIHEAYFLTYINRGKDAVKITDCYITRFDPNKEEDADNYRYPAHTCKLRHDLVRKVLGETI